MKIAIGTTRAPKVEGVKAGIQECPYFENPENIEYILKKVSSDVSDMPLSLEETMQGAKNRAKNLIKHGIDADFYIGIEGGVSLVGENSFLGGVTYIENDKGEGHYGFSAFMEIPKEIKRRLFEIGEELGPIMGELSGKVDIRSENGSMGAWSDDMFTRKDEFSTAFKAAIAPFYNEYYEL